MKLTVEFEGTTVSIDDPNALTGDDVVAVFRAAMLAMAFHPDTVARSFNDEEETRYSSLLEETDGDPS